jgi:hypothetical protein
MKGAPIEKPYIGHIEDSTLKLVTHLKYTNIPQTFLVVHDWI